MKKIIRGFSLFKFFLFAFIPVLLITTDFEVIKFLYNDIKNASIYSKLRLFISILFSFVIIAFTLVVNIIYLDFLINYQKAKNIKLIENEKDNR